MGFYLLAWVRAMTDPASPLTCQQAMVAIVLGRHANEASEAWPGLTLICAEAKVNRHTAIAAIRLLEKYGWCIRDTGLGRRTRYKLVQQGHWCISGTGAGEAPSKLTDATGTPVQQETGVPIAPTGVPNAPGPVSQLHPKETNEGIVPSELSSSRRRDEGSTGGIGTPVDPLEARTEASRFLFERTGRRRWANLSQRDAFEACEREVGLEAMKGGIDWALVSGISNIKSMITAARKAARHGTNGTGTSGAGAGQAQAARGHPAATNIGDR